MKLIKHLKIIVGMVCCLCYGLQTTAQTVVQASIDSTLIMIGKQTTIHLEVITDKDRFIEWPVITDTLTNGIWLLEKSVYDTTIVDNGRLSIKQDYLITSFDSALYVIPPFKLVSQTDTLYSNVVALKVITFPDVNPEEGFYDIKPILSPGFVFADYALYVWIVLGTLFIFSSLMYILQQRKKKEPIISFKASKPKLPPHVEAISHLDKIKVEKLWQQGRNKEYYTQITDVLRIYVMERFGVNALEMTSEDILSEIYRLHDAHSVYETLKKVLELSNLVKFAKYVPLPDDNEISLLNAYLFVNQTKIEEIQPSEEENKNPVVEKNQENN